MMPVSDDLTAATEAASLAMGLTGQAIAEALLTHALSLVPDTVAATERARFATMMLGRASGIGGANNVLLGAAPEGYASCIAAGEKLMRALSSRAGPENDEMPVLAVMVCVVAGFVTRARQNLAALTMGGSNGRPN